MGTIIPFLRDGVDLRDSVFEPHEIKAMSTETRRSVRGAEIGGQ
jgi:hypothetical protein